MYTVYVEGVKVECETPDDVVGLARAVSGQPSQDNGDGIPYLLSTEAVPKERTTTAREKPGKRSRADPTAKSWQDAEKYGRKIGVSKTKARSKLRQDATKLAKREGITPSQARRKLLK